MKLFKIAYAALGIGLAAGSILTGEYGLSKVNQEIYERALSLEDDIQELGFPEFSLADYKVRFYNGNCDYVVKGVQEKIKKENAALDIFAGTTVEVDGEYQVLVPTYEKCTSLFGLLNTAGTVSQGTSEGTMAFTEDTYSTNSHTAIIWHEAFHVWQQNRWQQEIEALLDRVNVTPAESRDDIIVSEVDTKQEAVEAFGEEMELLKKAYDAEGVQKIELIEKALAVAGKRKEILSESANAMEFYYENLEGSAMYVESQVYHILEGESAWREYYMGEFKYVKGSDKYYYMGMLKGALLDQISEGWQEGFCMECGLDELLSRACDK